MIFFHITKQHYLAPKNHKVDGKVGVMNNGEWTIMRVDLATNLNPQTREATAYLMPGPTNMRRAHGDNRMKPAHFWVGATHTANIVRIEPLD